MRLDILTATHNPGDTLGDCLRSVANQNWPRDWDVHHRVVDGASTDGTPATLVEWQSHSPKNRSFTSQPDNGLYDALNAGIRETSGDVVGILHADDTYYGPGVLEAALEAFADPAVDGVYGDLVYTQPGTNDSPRRITRYWRAGQGGPAALRWGWMPPHPSVFVRRSVFDRFGLYRTDFGSAADYEWLLRVLAGNQIRFHHVPEIFVAMRTGGMSNQSLRSRLQANSSDRQAWTINGLRPWPWTFLCKPARKLPQWLHALFLPPITPWWETAET